MEGDHTEEGRCPTCGGAHTDARCDPARPRPRETVEFAAARDPAAPFDPLVGSMVGSFKVQKLLGRGGMGSVYLAEHPIIGSRVAIKFLQESMCANPEAVRRFYDEARAVNLIGHENIVAIYDLAQLPPSRYYIVMEYLDGAPLSALLQAGRIAPTTAFDVLVQLAGALEAAHEHGVVHRDLKPENVFLLKRRGRDFVKLVDFGIAKLADRTTLHTASGAIVGTPEYMAPEQCDGRPIDRRTDVYALGVMAYELATGQLPFAGPSIPQILLAHARTAPTPPSAIDPSISPALEAAILRAMEKKPADRFQDMRSFVAALEAARSPARFPAGAGSPPAPQPAATATAGSTGSAAPARRCTPREVEVTFRGGDELPRKCHAREAAHGGVFLRAEGALPPLRSRVRIALRLQGRAPVELAGEVVRHVTAGDAVRWKMAPGFAVQLAALSAEQRSALEALSMQLAEPPAPTPAPEPSPLAFAELELRAAVGPYEALGARPDAEFGEIRERARAVRRQIEALRPSLPPDAQASRVPALLARIDAAVTQLGTPSERLMFDARRGNYQGVAHCVTAGIPAAVVAARRHTFLGEHPGHAERAQRHVARAQVATKLGNRAAALAEREAALTADPLDLDLHQAYWTLKRDAPR